MIIFVLTLIALAWWMIYDHYVFMQRMDNTEAARRNAFERDLAFRKKVVDAKLFYRLHGSYVVEVH